MRCDSTPTVEGATRSAAWRRSTGVIAQTHVGPSSGCQSCYVAPDDGTPTPAVRDDVYHAAAEPAQAVRRRALLAKVREEIDEEVAIRRSSGELPPDFEEGLDQAFAELSPGKGPGYLIRQALAVVDERAAVAIEVPVASRRPGGSLFKRLVRAAVGWYVRFFVGQLTRFAHAVARALHVLADDLEQLRNETSTRWPSLPEGVGGVAGLPLPEDRWWIALATSAFKDAPAPVLCGDTADLAPLRALREAGIDAYGVRDPRDAVGRETTEGFDVRDETLMDHARGLVKGTVGGAFLEGSIQWLGPRRSDELLGALESNLDVGTVLMVVSRTPQAWSRLCDPLLADLAPARPLHAETWAYLMERHGFVEPRVHRGGTDIGARLRSSSDDSASVDRELVAALESLLGGPDEYAVIAVRGNHTP